MFYGMIDTMLPQSYTPPLVVLVKPVQPLAATHNEPALLTYLRTSPTRLLLSSERTCH
jgi:hypothetical protein